MIQQYCCEEKLRADHSWGLKSLKRTKHGQFDSILIWVVCQFSLFWCSFSLPLISYGCETSFCSSCHHCIESLKGLILGCENLLVVWFWSIFLAVFRFLMTFSMVLQFLVDPNTSFLCILSGKAPYVYISSNFMSNEW